MATVGTDFNLMDIAQNIGGSQPVLVDAVASRNYGQLFRILPMKQITGWVERINRVTSYPTVSFRNLGEYVTPSKGETQAVQEGVFLLSGASKIDKIKAERDPRGLTAARAGQDNLFLKAMGRSLSYQTLYGDYADGKQYDGLFNRLPATADTFVSAGGSAEKYSIYALRFGEDQFMGTYNLGIEGELIEANPYGPYLDKDGSGNLNELYATFFNAAIGLSQYSTKSIGRIGKIDSSNKPTVADFYSLFEKMDGMPDVLVCNWTVAGYISDLKDGKLQMGPGDRNYDVAVDFFDGIPIVVDTAVSTDESAV